MRRSVRVSLALLCLLALPISAMAGNNISAGTAYTVQVGQRISETVAASTEAWFQYRLTGGHSYCVEADNSGNIGGQFSTVDTWLDIYETDGTTLLASNNNDTSGMEPRPIWGSRGCGIEGSALGASHDVLVRVTTQNGWAGTFDLRVVETTLFSAFLYTYGDFTSSIQIRNTTSAALGYVVRFRNNAGTVLATYAPVTPLAANASVNLNARNYVAANVSGSIEIAHTGTPEAIVANVTSLSVSTGLSFDGPFIKRQPW